MQAVALKHKLANQEKALKEKQALVEVLKETQDPSIKAKEDMDELREAAPQCEKTTRCETRYKPRYCSTEAVRKWIREAVGKTENQSFNELCTEVAQRGMAQGKQAGWSGKITFICAIIPQENFEFSENYTKWWYFEYDLMGKYYFLFMKVDHDRQSDKKYARQIIDEIKTQAN